MADSPTTPEEVKPVTPPAEPPVEPEFTNEDLKKQSFEDIAKNKEVPEVTPEPTQEEKDKIAADEKAKADAEALKKSEEEEKAVEPEELAEDISKRIAEKLSPKEETIVKNKYDEFFNKVKEEKGRDPNWVEVSQFLEDQAVLRMEAKQVEKQQAIEKQKEEETKATQAFTDRFNKQIDEELEELYKAGNLTPIKDKSNPSDQGVIERKALFQAMLDTNAARNKENQDKGLVQGQEGFKDTILSIARIYHGGYYTKPTAQPAGSEAPISMGKGTPAGGEDEQELDYNKDVKKPWSMFRKQ